MLTGTSEFEKLSAKETSIMEAQCDRLHVCKCCLYADDSHIHIHTKMNKCNMQSDLKKKKTK